MGFFRSKWGFFLDNTRVRIFTFFHRAKRKIFFRNLTLGYMTKTPNQVFFFFLHQNQNIFSTTLRIRIFFSGADNSKNTKSSISDHTYALPIATQPYIIENEPFSIYSEIETDTEVNAVQNEVLFDYIASDLVPLSHCRFIVDLGFMAEQLKHSILSVNPSCLKCLGG